MVRKWFRKTPVAWRQVMKEKTRLAVAVAGIAFADLLMFIQMAFLDSLFESTMRPQRSLEADLVLLNPHLETLFSVKSFPRERLYQALALEGVESVSPVYVALGQWRNPETHRSRTILVFGADPTTKVFNFPEVNQNLSQLQMLNQVLFDQASRPEYGPIPSLFQKRSSLEVQMERLNLRVVGLFTMGASFAADGNVITSDSTFLRIFPEHKPDKIEIGLIKLKPGADVEQVAKTLRAGLPNDVMVLTREGFAELEKGYWANATPIGFVFGLGVIVGFIVGIVIVYQILYSDVSEHLPQYATLKAMGYSNRYLVGLILQEALLLAVLGYIPGFVLSLGLYQLAAAATLLPIYMTVERGVTVFILTVTMCLSSGTVAMRKLQAADPADIF